jgi:integrase
MPVAGRRRKDRSILEGKCIQNLREAIKSPLTLDHYERMLAFFFRDVNLTCDEFVGKAKADPQWAQGFVLEYMLRMKQKVLDRKMAAGSIGNIRKPVRLLLDMNDVTGINWKRISRLMPRERKFALDRAPTLDEIRRMLSDADLRFQAVLLTMVSSGIRIGAWDYLDWGHVEPVGVDGRVVAAKLRVYAGDPEEYFSFVTPEAYGKLKEYVELRASHGEKIDGDSPLVRDRFQPLKTGSYAGSVERPERLASSGVKRLIEDVFWKMGMRKERKRRHEFSIHSFRKFFKTRAEQVMKPINVETLMGHSVGISDSYYRPIEKDMLEDYLRAVPLLTVSETEEVRRVAEVSREQLEGRLHQLEELVSRLTTSIGQQALAQSQNHSAGTSSGSSPRKIVKAEEIESYIEKGWEPVLTLPDGRVVMKEPA